MTLNRGGQPSPVTTFETNALELAESPFLCGSADERSGPPAAPNESLAHVTAATIGYGG
jgi:hypothetical protein